MNKTSSLYGMFVVYHTELPEWTRGNKVSSDEFCQYHNVFYSYDAAERHLLNHLDRNGCGRVNGPGGYHHEVRELTHDEFAKWEDTQIGGTASRALSVPWTGQRWFLSHRKLYWSVMVDDGQVSFYASKEHRASGRRTRMKPGKFLKKYFSDILTDKRIAHAAEWFNGNVGAFAPEGFEVKFTKDPEEFVRIYENGPESCMTGKGWKYPLHPAMVYAAGDLALAYVEDPDGQIIARGLCWPERKAFGRVYTDCCEIGGETYEATDIEAAWVDALRKMEWLHYSEYREENTGFDGARLNLIHDYDNEKTVMPYFDHHGYQYDVETNVLTMRRGGTDHVGTGGKCGFLGTWEKHGPEPETLRVSYDRYKELVSYQDQAEGHRSEADYWRNLYEGSQDRGARALRELSRVNSELADLRYRLALERGEGLGGTARSNSGLVFDRSQPWTLRDMVRPDRFIVDEDGRAVAV